MSVVVDALERETRLFGARLRQATARWYEAGAPPFATRADVAFHVVRRIAHAGFAVERPGAPFPTLSRLPDLALADQFAVVTADLLVVTDDAVAAAMLAEVLLHRTDLDGSAPGGATTALVAALTGEPDPVAWRRVCTLVG